MAGTQFVYQELTVIKRKWDFDSRVYFSDGPQVTIMDCLNNKFKYSDLMSRDLS
jgi:hypothetical protein